MNDASDDGNAWGSKVVRALAEEYIKTYPATTDQEARESRAKFETDLRYGWDMWTWGRMQAKTGRAKVFSYYFAHLPPYPKGSSFADWRAGTLERVALCVRPSEPGVVGLE